MQHLLIMGEHFCASAERRVLDGCGRLDNQVFQELHWGLELLLKAFLRSRGWSDARCRVEIRHDITKALSACEREGLAGVDARARRFVTSFAPFSRAHRVRDFVEVGAAGWSASAAVAAIAPLRRAILGQSVAE
jgi:hypothetical protein